MHRTLKRLSVAILMLIGLATGLMTTTASAASTPVAAAHHAVTGRSADDLAAVASGGTVTLENKYSHMCLDDYGFSNVAGNAMVQWPCDGLRNQQWQMAGSLANLFSNMCLDDYGFSNAAGNVMV